MNLKKSVGVWIRVSTEDQAKGESPIHHLERAKMYARVKNWDVVTEYHLEGVSGKSVINHPEAQRMIRDVRAGKISGLIFSKIARLARNTKELIEFSEIFQECSADLISLDETIDTSTPAGRFFYSIISAMSQWEREEIAGRVAASVPIRAKLGKPLGGQAPYGYQWVDKKLVVDEKEAPVRKLMFELFKEHKRKLTVANLLNEKGYRTRNGSKFTPPTVIRLLSDPLAKGVRRSNYTKSSGEGKHWKLKSEDDWVFTEAPAIVSEELWDEVNTILTNQSSSFKRPLKRVRHLFTNIVTCHCGSRMLVKSNNPKYICVTCKNKIPIDTIEEIYHAQLHSFVFSDDEIRKYFEVATSQISDQERHIDLLTSNLDEINKKLDNLIEMNMKGELPTKGFKKHYEPLHEQAEQLELEIEKRKGELQAHASILNEKNHLVYESRDLYTRWHTLSDEQKRYIVETITEKIVVFKDEIEISLYQLPSLSPQTPLSELMALDEHNYAPAVFTTTHPSHACAGRE